MFASHWSMTPSAIGVWSNSAAGRPSVNQITWFEESPSCSRIRSRAANDCRALCMLSDSSR
jgi:hypothetical protein